MSGPCTDCGGPDYQTLVDRIAELEAENDRLREDKIDLINQIDNGELVITAEAERDRTTEELREALSEIAEGRGAFSRNPLIHAENTIESMKNIAGAALHPPSFDARAEDGSDT